MAPITSSATVGQIVAARPQLARVFEAMQIDYCCGGKRSLDAVCRERGIEVGMLVQRLTDAEATSPKPAGEDWQTATLAELCENIERRHHDFLRRELPRLDAIIAKVVNAHGATHPELAEVQRVFQELRAELEPHMMKEERILFPAIRYLEANGRAMQLPFGSLANPIGVMVSDHDQAGDALARLRQLTGGYLPPTGACNTYRVMLEGLEALERDMHEHVHKENNILFPRAVEMEASLGNATMSPSESACHCATA